MVPGWTPDGSPEWGEDIKLSWSPSLDVKSFYYFVTFYLFLGFSKGPPGGTPEGTPRGTPLILCFSVKTSNHYVAAGFHDQLSNVSAPGHPVQGSGAIILDILGATSVTRLCELERLMQEAKATLRKVFFRLGFPRGIKKHRKSGFD